MKFKCLLGHKWSTWVEVRPPLLKGGNALTQLMIDNDMLIGLTRTCQRCFEVENELKFTK